MNLYLISDAFNSVHATMDARAADNTNVEDGCREEEVYRYMLEYGATDRCVFR